MTVLKAVIVLVLAGFAFVTPAAAWLGEETLAPTSLKPLTGQVHDGEKDFLKFKFIALTSRNAEQAYRELTNAFGPFPIRIMGSSLKTGLIGFVIMSVRDLNYRTPRLKAFSFQGCSLPGVYFEIRRIQPGELLRDPTGTTPTLEWLIALPSLTIEIPSEEWNLENIGKVFTGSSWMWIRTYPGYQVLESYGNTPTTVRYFPDLCQMSNNSDYFVYR